jgi:UDP-glucose 4-epimerase
LPCFLVTGGLGFIGSNLVKTLYQAEQKIVIFDNLRTGSLWNLKGIIPKRNWSKVSLINRNSPPGKFILNEKVTFYKASLEHTLALEQVFEENPISHIFHLAALVSVRESIKYPLLTEKINTGGTIKLLQIASKKHGGMRVIFAGSAAEYGEVSRLPIQENTLLRPQTPYGISKCSGEYYVSIYPGIVGTTLRCFNIYGPYQDPTSPYSGVISKFLKCIAEGEQIPVFGDGEQTRDFVYIKDVIRAYLLAAGFSLKKDGRLEPLTTTPPRGAINIGSGERITINKLAELIKEVGNSASEIVHLKPRQGEIRHSQAEIKKAKQELNWRPHYSLKKGLLETLKWYLSMQRGK